jgi:hypothetical protein
MHHFLEKAQMLIKAMSIILLPFNVPRLRPFKVQIYFPGKLNIDRQG